MTAPSVLALLTAGWAVISDLRERRIPNALTFGSAATALLYRLGAGGVHGFEMALLGWFVGMCLFLPFFLLRGMGAGDVKLLAALGAWLGPQSALWLAIYSSVFGGVLALCVAIWAGYLGTVWTNVRLMVMHWRIAGFGPVPGVNLADAKAPRVAYAVPIAMGALCTLLFR